jgi:hypothetical protein
MKPKGIEESGVRGIASRHGYEVKRQPLALYDLTTDVGETTNLSVKQPAVVARLRDVAERARDDLGDALTKHRGRNLRAVGQWATEKAK